jgi:beta-phosphoglucomutase-like phosphatase (HAD superfamily)
VTEDAQWALLFDCDGVIVQTEELHRLAYNGTLKEMACMFGGKHVRGRAGEGLARKEEEKRFHQRN